MFSGGYLFQMIFKNFPDNLLDFIFGDFSIAINVHFFIELVNHNFSIPVHRSIFTTKGIS